MIILEGHVSFQPEHMSRLRLELMKLIQAGLSSGQVLAFWVSHRPNISFSWIVSNQTTSRKPMHLRNLIGQH